MDLPNLFSSGSKNITEELVLFLIISDVQVQILLLELSGAGVVVKEKSKPLEYEGLDNCVIQTDKALQQLSKESEKINEIIFAVNSSWVKSGEVLDEKKPFFKKLSEDLSLTPLGFIDISESLSQQKIIQNSLFSSILVVFSKSELSFTLIHQGKIKKTEIVGSSSDFLSDFEEGIARIQKVAQKQGNYLPSKVLLSSFDLPESDLKEYQQKIYNLAGTGEKNWKKDLKFLQEPTVSLLNNTDFLLLLSNEAGKNVALQKGLSEFAFAASVGHVAPDDDSNEKAVMDTQEVTNLDSEELGFSDPLKAAPTSFGIPIKTADFDLKAVEEDDNLKKADFNFETAVEEPMSDLTKDKENKNLKKAKRDWGHHKNTKWFIILGFILGLVFLFIGLILGSSFITQTEAIVTLNKKPVSKDITITLDTSLSETDVENLIIAASTIKKSASSKSTLQTTGIKIVGEKAKGRVALYNKTDAVKKFDKGTLLKSGELLFSLDEDVSVASASSKQGGEDYGREDVNVTAEQIGAESNLAEKSELLVASYDTSSYNAFIIDEDFVGGSSREVRVVAQKDRTELLTDLREELIETINEEFKNESGNGVYILPSKAVTKEVAEFDAEVESEAEDLTLNLEIEIEAVTYSGADLKPVAEEILSKEILEKYKLEDADPQILSSPSQNDLDELGSGAVVSIEANISSYGVPIISEDEVKQEIVGKTLEEANSILTQKETISKVELVVNPSILRSFITKVASSIDKITVTFLK